MKPFIDLCKKKERTEKGVFVVVCFPLIMHWYVYRIEDRCMMVFCDCYPCFFVKSLNLY